MTAKQWTVILASTSKYRVQLLASTGLNFRSVDSQVNESEIIGTTAKEVALQRALAKATAVSLQNPGDIVIGADQTLDFQGKIRGKAENQKQAFEFLKEMSGHGHILHSAVAITQKSEDKKNAEIISSFVIDVPMHMRKLSDGEISKYLETAEWKGCAGCYQYENVGMNLFEKIGGDHSSIIGLPLLPLLKELRNMGIGPLL